MSDLQVLRCEYHSRGLCRSCTGIGHPYDRQLADKHRLAQELLASSMPDAEWLTPTSSPASGFRNKAKLAVGGTLEHPTLGITDTAGHGTDLRECGVHERALWEIIPDLAGFVTLAGLQPYDVASRTGSLKFIIVTVNPRGDLMVRFVVRTTDEVEVLCTHLPALLARLPRITSVSANLHPEHKAVLDGAREIHLHGPDFFQFPLRDRTLFLHHRSFFQTNTVVAQQLYDQARKWTDAVEARSVLDLHCGVGGFACHVAAPGRRVHGVEIENDAVEAARLATAALPLGVGPVTFAAGDATEALAADTDLVIVNPPRRGLGAELCQALERSGPPHVIYSSCNPSSLEADLARLPSYRAVSARLFDMFPQTEHSEVAVLLQLRPVSVKMNTTTA